MPFGHQILIPGGVFLGVGGAGCRSFSPDVGQPHAEDGISHVGNRRPQRIFGKKAPTGIEDVPVALAMVSCADAFETDVGPQSVQAEQEPFLNGRPIQVLSNGRTLKAIGKAHAQVRFLEDIQQFDH